MSDFFVCPCCGKESVINDGILMHAPNLAYEGGGFKSESFENLVKLEEKNFWFRSRSEIIFWIINKFIKENNRCNSLGNYLEIGCGTGYVLKGVMSEFKDMEMFGSEIFLSGLKHAKRRLDNVTLMQMDARAIPYKAEFDVIGGFDVLEHIKEDEKVISEVYRALKPNGYFIVTVPQHDWLWSMSDDYACHERRYEKNEIINKLKNEGFKIVKTTSFVSLLLPIMYLSRFRNKKNNRFDYDPSLELRLNPHLNNIFLLIMRLEILLIKMGLSFSVGGSRLVLARKP